MKVKASKFLVWYTSELMALIKVKERARMSFIKHGRDKSSVFYKNFCTPRAEVKTAQKECHSDFVQRISHEIKGNPKRFWSYVKTLKNSSAFTSSIYFNGVESTSLKDIVRSFSQYFESAFSVSSEDTFPYCPRIDVPILHLPVVSAEEMKQKIFSLDLALDMIMFFPFFSSNVLIHYVNHSLKFLICTSAMGNTRSF